MKWLKRIAMALVGLVVLAVAGLWIAGKRPSAGTLDVTVEIGRPAAEVWPWLTEPGKLPQWVSWLKEVRSISPGTNGVGAREQWVMQDMNNGGALMRLDSVSTVFDPPRRLGAHVGARDAFGGDFSYELMEVDGKTKVRAQGAYQYQHWLARLFEPLITPEARKKLEGDLARLKRLAEAETRGAATAAR